MDTIVRDKQLFKEEAAKMIRELVRLRKQAILKAIEDRVIETGDTGIRVTYARDKWPRSWDAVSKVEHGGLIEKCPKWVEIAGTVFWERT